MFLEYLESIRQSSGQIVNMAYKLALLLVNT